MMSLSQTDKRSRIATICPGRDDPPTCRDPSRLVRPTFSPPSIIPLKLFKSLVNGQTVTNHHHPSRVVAIRPDRDDLPTISPPFIVQIWFFLSPSWPGKRSRVATIHPKRDDLPRCHKLTNSDGPSRPVMDRHQFDDPLRIGCIGQPSNLFSRGCDSFCKHQELKPST